MARTLSTACLGSPASPRVGVVRQARSVAGPPPRQPSPRRLGGPPAWLRLQRLATRTDPPRLEVEALLRLLFADHGEPEHLLRVLDELEHDIGEHHEAIVELMGSYLDGGHPFPDRTHLSVLFATFQLEIFRAIERWIDFARDEVDAWPTTRGLGMNARTEAITRALAEDRSPLDEE